MGLVHLFFFGLIVGSVVGDHLGPDNSKRSDEVDEKELYSARLQESFKAYGHCIIFNSMTTTVNNSDIAKQCVEVSTIQALLPALYIEVGLRQSTCIENLYEKLMETKEWDEIQTIFGRYLEKKASEREFCAFLDIFLAPFLCLVRHECPGEKEDRFSDGIIASYYSIQQFLNNGMDTHFRCKKTDIKINPALYQFGTKYNENVKYLTKGLQCQKYEPKKSTSKSTTSTSTTTTTELPTTTDWFWGKTDGDDDESDFGKWFGSSEDVSTAEEKEPSTTTKKPSKSEPVRVRLNRHERGRSDHH
jgi:hypothetical protein